MFSILYDFVIVIVTLFTKEQFSSMLYLAKFKPGNPGK